MLKITLTCRIEKVLYRKENFNTYVVVFYKIHQILFIDLNIVFVKLPGSTYYIFLLKGV